MSEVILLAHGAGGRKSADLIRDLFLRHFGNPALNVLGDSAVLEIPGGKVAFTTDSFVVDPLFFPGGDIGKLAVCGTVNDLAAAGARPLALSAAFILEEGLDLDTLERVVASMARTASEVGVPIVTGDTKVVPRGSADRIFITTSGIGIPFVAQRQTPPQPSPQRGGGYPPTLPPRCGEGWGGVCLCAPSPECAAQGDAVILSGTIADHGMAVMTCREGISFESEIESDCAPLDTLVVSMLEACPDIHCLRDPTRGGVATSLNEIAVQSGVCIEIYEPAIPVNENVRVACELLGIDPLHVANEGKMLAVVPQECAEAVVEAMRAHPYGRRACVIGRVQERPAGRVHLRTALGSLRILDIPAGDLLPRIC